MPDVPADSIRIVPGGGLALGTDLAAFYRAPGATAWKVLGNGLPATVMQLRIGSDGDLCAATHGRGIWSFDFGHPPAATATTTTDTYPHPTPRWGARLDQPIRPCPPGACCAYLLLMFTSMPHAQDLRDGSL
ncbi:hypothetical protein [Streptomyces sp. NPDC005407]|uniref:hypothetical protein n=1 Tax=Streptomyces sp. NPDC005407 TaxID=3155340 RepID=UPI0033B91834